MTAAEFVGLANEIIFLVIFVVTLARAIRLRTVPSVEIAAFFALIAGAQQVGNALDLLGLGETPVADKVTVVVLPILPYLLIRIADHFTPLPLWLRFGALLLMMATLVLGLAAPTPLPPVVAVVLVAWCAAGGAYASLVFVREARTAIGVTARRLESAAVGSGLLAAALVVALAGVLVPPLSDATGMMVQLLVAGTGLAYYAGFATPTWLRRTWQEPAVRTFLAHSAELTREPDEASALRRMTGLVAEVLGTQHAFMGVANADGSRLRWWGVDDVPVQESPADQWIAGRAFTTGQTVLSANPAADDPMNAQAYRAAGAGTVMAAPMAVGDRRFGVIVAYARRAPVFAYSDRDLITVLAQQAAGILEARLLLREAAEVQAREVATRAKEDFLSAAAHDLRTPLSSMVLRAELLHRRLEREESPHADAVRLVLADAGRVAEFVDDLLDAARAEQGRLSGDSEAVDLASVVHDVVAARRDSAHEVVVDGSPTQVLGDRRRLQQVVENLVGNAQKYSPNGGQIRIEVGAQDGVARLSVRDEGIGVAPEDLPHLFERFSRGRNVDDRRFSGLGLGLYICRRIVEEHGGRIWAESELGAGTTIRVEIPTAAPEVSATDG